MIIESKKPLVGHNMMFDTLFIYHQFIDDLPPTFDGFIKGWTKRFPVLYDTKVLSEVTNYFSKTELQHLFDKCCTDKKFCNNLVIEFDSRRDLMFGIYNTEESKKEGIRKFGGQGHDAAYDAFMTGLVFLSIGKYIEIGKIIIPVKQQQLSQMMS